MNEALALKIGNLLLEQRKTVTCAESCTGGGISYSLTSVPGSSKWFEEGFVTYSNIAKAALLNVEESLILEAGAVSERVIDQMLSGALKRARADYAIAVSGIAGPDGGTVEKPVGTVCIGWGDRDEHSVLTYLFQGERAQIREQAITQSLLNIYQFIKTR